MAMSISATDDSGPIVDMNTTPLVDVMLVLLILFIITLPVMTSSTNLHIGGEPSPLPRESISLTIDFDGTILWNGTTYLNAEIVRRGGAWFYTEFARGPALYDVEQEARKEKRGLWALPLKDRIEPWEWRKRKRPRN